MSEDRNLTEMSDAEWWREKFFREVAHWKERAEKAESANAPLRRLARIVVEEIPPERADAIIRQLQRLARAALKEAGGPTEEKP